MNETERIESVMSPNEIAAAKADIYLLQSYLNKINETPFGCKERIEGIISMMSYMYVSPLSWKTYPRFYTAVQTKIADLLTRQLPAHKVKWAHLPDMMTIVHQCENVTKLLDEKMKE